MRISKVRQFDLYLKFHWNFLISLIYSSLFSSCSTATACLNPTTTEPYKNTVISSLGGIKTTLSCCLADEFEDDDVVAVDYSMICNAGVLKSSPTTFGFLALTLVSLWILIVA